MNGASPTAGSACPQPSCTGVLEVVEGGFFCPECSTLWPSADDIERQREEQRRRQGQMEEVASAEPTRSEPIAPLSVEAPTEPAELDRPAEPIPATEPPPASASAAPGVRETYDVDELMSKDPRDLTGNELSAVKKRLLENAHMREVAGDAVMDATEKLHVIMPVLAALDEIRYQLVRVDLAKQYGVSVKTLDALYKQGHPPKPAGRVTPATEEDGRDPIIANNRDLRELSRECIAALAKRNAPPRIFRRGTTLVRIVQDGIESLTEYRMRHELARVAAFMERSAKGALTKCPPPLEAVRDVPAWEALPFPEILTIAHGPAFDEEGNLLQEPGYHEKAKIFIDRRVDVKTFEGTPEAAAAWIDRELFSDFPFASPADRANAMGALFSCICRAIIRGCIPMIGVQASIHGAGKGLLVDVVTTAAFGAPGAELASYSEQEDETRKHITASLRNSPGAVKIDNVKDRIDSSVLSSVLTAQEWSDRVLGKTEIVTYKVLAVFFSTGNNPSLSGEIARRYVRIRLTPSTETPWTREGFRHDNLLEWVTEHRGEIIGAVARIVQGWVSAGRPAWSGRPLGSFESWSRIVGGMLQSCGVQGFMENHAELFEAADSDGEAWRQLVDRWEEQYPTVPVTAGDLFALTASVDGFPIEGSTEHGQRIAFGRALAKQNDRVFDDRRIVREMDKKKHGAKYRLQVGQKGMSGNKGNVPAALHARDLELFPYGVGPRDIPIIPDIPPHSPSIPADLSPLSRAELETLAHATAIYMDGDPPHPELQPGLDRLTAELSARAGGST